MYLNLEHLSKSFPAPIRGTGAEVTAVADVSLAIGQGEFVTLLGPSGCGKTTTLRLIAGFEVPTQGHISLDGRSLDDVPPNRRDMAMVFQSYALFPHLSVFENIAYGLRLKKLSSVDMRRKIAEALRLTELSGLEQRAPNQLSGGQQQRVALARRWSWNQKSCCSTSRCPTWMPNCASRCAPKSAASSKRSASPASTSRTIRPRP